MMGLRRTHNLRKLKIKSTCTNQNWKWLVQIWTKTNTPPSFFMDSIVSPKVTKTKKKRNWGAFLGLQHFENLRSVRALGWGLEDWQASQLLTQTYTNQTTSWLICNWNTFSAHMSHKQTWIHKTHHGMDLREATAFPLIVFFVPSHRANTQMSICPMTPTWESRNSQNWNFCNFIGP